jgi:nitrile hydratase accessory protein
LGSPDPPVFAEPWQAQAFALVVALRNAGVLGAEEWSRALGAEIERSAASGGCRDGSDHYERWCAALEHLLVAKGLAARAAIEDLAASWARAAAATPHGKPIRPENDPQRGRAL